MLKSCNHVSLYTPVSKQVTENRHRMTLCCRLFTNTVTIGFACCVQEEETESVHVICQFVGRKLQV